MFHKNAEFWISDGAPVPNVVRTEIIAIGAFSIAVQERSGCLHCRPFFRLEGVALISHIRCDSTVARIDLAALFAIEIRR